MSPVRTSNGGQDAGLKAPPTAGAPEPDTPRAGRGLTNGNGPELPRARQGPAKQRTGGGRTTGGGLTNGSGRTNGGGLTNGSGRTNGGQLAVLASQKHLARTRAARRHRTQALVAGLLLAFTTVMAAGVASDAASGPRVDGRFDEWAGHTAAVSGGGSVGLRAVGVMSGRLAPQMLLEFAAAPFAAREDVWVFLDLDRQGGTGYWTGALGADAAVALAGQGGRLAAATAYTFEGLDRFDLRSLFSHGRTLAAAQGALIELQVPGAPFAFEIARATPQGASSAGAFDLTGASVAFASGTVPLTHAVQNGVRIDGDFSDWAGVPLTADATDGALPQRLDLLRVAAIGDAGSAQFLAEVQGAALEGTLPVRAEPIRPDGPGSAAPAPPPRRTAGTDQLDIYLDTDRDGATGAVSFGLGAERLLRVEGVGGVVVLAQFFAYQRGAWVPDPGHAEAAAAGGNVEASVEAAGLVGAAVRFTLTGFDGQDQSDADLQVAGEAGAARESVGTMAVAPPGESGVLLNPIPEPAAMAAVAGALGVFLVSANRRRRRRDGEGHP